MSCENKVELFDWQKVKSFHEFHEFDINGKDVEFKQYEGSRVLVIFAASTKILMRDKKCNPLIPREDCTGSLTYPKVLFFACNEFHSLGSGLSPDDVEVVRNECHFAIPVFPKVQIQGESAHSLWKWLNAHACEIVNPDIDELDRVEFDIDAEGKVERRVNIFKPKAYILLKTI